jgi:hypothetical protein
LNSPPTSRVEKAYWDLDKTGRQWWDGVMATISVKMLDRGAYWNYEVHKWVLPGEVAVGPYHPEATK